MEEVIQTKVCSRCKLEKSIDKFGIDKNRKDGLNCYCKQCRKENRLPKQYIEVKTKICIMCNQEKDVEKFTKDVSKPDMLCPYCKTCRKIIKHNFYELHKETILNKHKIHYKGNKLKSYERSKKYRLNNADRINKNRIKNRKSDILKYLIRECVFRAREVKNVPYDSKEDLYNYLKPIYDKGKCECCGRILESNVGKGVGHGCDSSYSIDRLIPDKGYVMENVSLLCMRCNYVKNNATIQEHRMIANWMEQKLNQQNIPLEEVNIDDLSPGN